jgi:hypothetical protein
MLHFLSMLLFYIRLQTFLLLFRIDLKNEKSRRIFRRPWFLRFSYLARCFPGPLFGEKSILVKPE